MKVTIGEVVKNIPKQFVDGVFLISEEQFEAPKKVRLTPFERFLFAEAAWRINCDSFVREYLDRLYPTHAEMQTNRAGAVRHVVWYDSEDDIGAMAIVPWRVWNKCPNELRTKQKMEFHGR